MEQPADRALRRNRAAVFGDDAAQLGRRAIAVVGGQFDQDGHAVRPENFVGQLLVIGRVASGGACRFRTLFGGGLGHQLGQREPLRRGPAELLRVFVGQRLELGRLADGAIQIEQHQPGLRMLCACTARPRELRDRLLALLEVGVGEGDHRLIQLGVVHRLADLDGEWVAEVGTIGVGGEGQGRQRRDARRQRLPICRSVHRLHVHGLLRSPAHCSAGESNA